MTRHYEVTHFNHDKAIPEETLRQYVPSIFAVDAHWSRSQRFAPVPTIEMVRGLAYEGWSVVRAGQCITRDPSRHEFTKHMLRFRRLDRTDLSANGSVLELLLVNGNDGSAAYNLEAGMFRVACLNGMIVKSKDFGGIKVRHSGHAFAKVIEGSYEVLKHAEAALRAPVEWSRIQLDRKLRLAFAHAAAAERWGINDMGRIMAPVTPEELLEPRRVADAGTDLWSTFNVLQENTIRGGLETRTATGRRMTTRQVNGIDQNVKVNKGLWVLGEYLADRYG